MKIPRRLLGEDRKLCALALKHANGDWSRITKHPKGGLMVHNKPQFTVLDLDTGKTVEHKPTEIMQQRPRKAPRPVSRRPEPQIPRTRNQLFAALTDAGAVVKPATILASVTCEGTLLGRVPLDVKDRKEIAEYYERLMRRVLAVQEAQAQS